MQHKNLSNPSPAKVAQDKVYKLVKQSNTGITTINDIPVFKYVGGSTHNCQIGSATILDDALFLEYLTYLKNINTQNFLNKLDDIFKSWRDSRYMVSLTYRTRILDSIIKEYLESRPNSRNIQIETIFYKDSKKFTNLLIII